MTKRLITKKQEQALRLCHHDFGGLNQTKAAERLGVSPSVVSQMLKRVEQILPQYFPILTKFEWKCYDYYMNKGWSVKVIAEHQLQTENAVRKALNRAKKKGLWWPKAHNKVTSYDALQERYRFINDGDVTDDEIDVNDNWLDFHVKQKF